MTFIQSNGWTDRFNIKTKMAAFYMMTGQLLQYTILQLQIVRSGLHLVTYLVVGNFCDKSTKTT